MRNILLRTRFAFSLVALGLVPGWAQEEVVFRSDVSLVRVDVQVLDSTGRAIAHLNKEDFQLFDQGKAQPIRNFVAEEMPLDVLFLFDVSGSMRPHIERVARASQQALNILGPEDRIAIMVFDRRVRLRMPFRKGPENANREMDNLLRSEGFNGGTEITDSIIDAARYVRREGRKEARRAIVIVTDDQTGGERNEPLVAESLGDIVLSALIAPDAMGNRVPGLGIPTGRSGGTWPGGGWPGSGGSWPGGGTTWPGGGGGRSRGPVILGGGSNGTQSAGTPQIARESGGDSLPVENASALDDTLSGLRQRYSLYFLVPDGARKGQERSIEVRLAGRRNAGADLRYRPTYLATENGSSPSEAVSQAPPATVSSDSAANGNEAPPKLSRRRPVNDPGGTRSAAGPLGGPASSTTPAPAQQGGWPRVKQ